MLNLFKSFIMDTDTRAANDLEEPMPNGNSTPVEMSEETINGENDLLNSLSSEDSFEKSFSNIKNESIKKCISTLIAKIDEITERNNFLVRNNDIILSRLKSMDEENKKLKKELDIMREDFDEDLYKIERNILKNEQYTRRESLVITGIPNSVSQRNLEPIVLKNYPLAGL